MCFLSVFISKPMRFATFILYPCTTVIKNIKNSYKNSRYTENHNFKLYQKQFVTLIIRNKRNLIINKINEKKIK